MSDPFTPFSDLALTYAGINRQTSARCDDTWVAERWQAATSRVLLVAQGDVPYAEVGAQARLVWRTCDEVPDGERYLLGMSAEGEAYFAVRVETLPDDVPHAGVRQLADRLSALEAELMVHAVALANWHANHVCCPRCGAATEVVKAGAERRCCVDGSAHFPRTDPAVIVLVTDAAGRALLGRQAGWPAGRFSTLAGFVEPGESAEQAVIREVTEESGVTVSEVRYLGSQPWPFPASLMLGYAARASGGTPFADGEELVEVRWFEREEFRAGVESGSLIPPSDISIAHRLIERWFGGPLPTRRPESS